MLGVVTGERQIQFSPIGFDKPSTNYPADPFTVMKLQKPWHDVPERHKIVDCLIARL